MKLLEEVLLHAKSLKLGPAQLPDLFFEGNIELLDPCSNLREFCYFHHCKRLSFMLNQSELQSELFISHSDRSSISILAGFICQLLSGMGSRSVVCIINESDEKKHEINHIVGQSPVVGAFHLHYQGVR